MNNIDNDTAGTLYTMGGGKCGQLGQGRAVETCTEPKVVHVNGGTVHKVKNKTKLFFFFSLGILRRIGKNKALGHHTSTFRFRVVCRFNSYVAPVATSE